MKDKYLILRFLGFYLLRTNQLGNLEYKSDIDEFLAAVMKQINSYDDSKIVELENLFLNAMNNCYKVLGNNAYRFDNPERRRPINMGLFESLSYAFALPRAVDSSNAVKYRFDKADEIRMELSHA